jgi:hypothetical protein
LNCEKIWEIQKKSKLNSERIWKLWKKSKLNSEKIMTMILWCLLSEQWNLYKHIKTL